VDYDATNVDKYQHAKIIKTFVFVQFPNRAPLETKFQVPRGLLAGLAFNFADRCHNRNQPLLALVLFKFCTDAIPRGNEGEDTQKGKQVLAHPIGEGQVLRHVCRTHIAGI